MINPSSVYQLSSNVRYRKIAGEGVVIQQTSSEVIMLNETGSDVLDLLDGRQSVKDIIKAISTDYGLEIELLSKDVTDYVQQLLDAGVVSEKVT